MGHHELVKILLDVVSNFLEQKSSVLDLLALAEIQLLSLLQDELEQLLWDDLGRFAVVLGVEQNLEMRMERLQDEGQQRGLAITFWALDQL